MRALDDYELPGASQLLAGLADLQSGSIGSEDATKHVQAEPHTEALAPDEFAEPSEADTEPEAVEATEPESSAQQSDDEPSQQPIRDVATSAEVVCEPRSASNLERAGPTPVNGHSGP